MPAPLQRAMSARYAALIAATFLAAAVAVLLTSSSATAQTPPQSVVDAARADLAARQGVPQGQITLERSEPVVWNSGCLGAAEPGEACTLALVAGYVLWLAVDGDAYRYHTGSMPSAIRFVAGPIPVANVANAPIPPGATPGHDLNGGGFVGGPPAAAGVTLAIWGGGAVDDLASAAPGSTSFWVTIEGRFIGLIPGAPTFVNAEFRSRFAGGQIPSGTPMVVVRPAAGGAVAFDQTGNLVRDTPGLPAGAWHLVYEAPGAPALTVRLNFTGATQCLTQNAAVDCDEIAVGTRVRVEGTRSGDVVTVSLLTIPGASSAIEVYFLDEPAFVAATQPFEVPVTRIVTGEAVATAALDALFAGPTPSEHAEGLRLIASGATGAEVTSIANGVANVRLQGGCDSGGATFTVANLILPTLTQFSTVTFVKIYDPAGTTGQPAGASNSIPACLEP